MDLWCFHHLGHRLLRLMSKNKFLLTMLRNVKYKLHFWPYKWIFFVEKMQISSFYFKKNRHKKLGKVLLKFNFRSPKLAKLFLTWSKENNFLLSWSSFLALKKQRKLVVHTSLAQASTRGLTKLLSPFYSNSNNFLRPCAKLKSNISKWNFGFWVP